MKHVKEFQAGIDVTKMVSGLCTYDLNSDRYSIADGNMRLYQNNATKAIVQRVKIIVYRTGYMWHTTVSGQNPYAPTTTAQILNPARLTCLKWSLYWIARIIQFSDQPGVHTVSPERLSVRKPTDLKPLSWCSWMITPITVPQDQHHSASCQLTSQAPSFIVTTLVKPDFAQHRIRTA